MRGIRCYRRHFPALTTTGLVPAAGAAGPDRTIFEPCPGALRSHPNMTASKGNPMPRRAPTPAQTTEKQRPRPQPTPYQFTDWAAI